MGAETKIQWTHHTWSPWIGCTKVSAGCANCYAAERDSRWRGGHWGPGAPRQRTSISYWRHPIRWNKEALESGERRRVFPSLCDPFDAEAPAGALGDFLRLILATDGLDWLLLTKRPERIPEALAAENFASLPRNVWLGISAEDQETFNVRARRLVAIEASVRFLSLEPLLGPIDTRPWLYGPSGIDWAIIGGESGRRARELDIDWVRSIVEQCRDAGTAVFVKQLGDNAVEDVNAYVVDPSAFARPMPLGLEAAKGGDPNEWPADLRVREFPEVRHHG